MSVPVFIAIVFALAVAGEFVTTRAHAKRMGAREVPFLLEAYREIDAMGLNGPRMAPPVPAEHDFRSDPNLAEFDPVSITTVNAVPTYPWGRRQQEVAPSYPGNPGEHGRLGRVANERYDRQARSAATASESRKFVSDVGDVEVRYAYRNGEWKTIWLPQEVAEYPPALDKAIRDAKLKLDCEDMGVVPARGTSDAPSPTEYNAVAAANDEYHRQAAEAARLNAALAEWQRGAQGQA